MSLREDLIEISQKEGFESVRHFIQGFVVNDRRTFMDLKKYLESKYKRYYSWAWVYIHCSPYVPDHRVQLRERRRLPGGCCEMEFEEKWNLIARQHNYYDANTMMKICADGRNVAKFARSVNVKYQTFRSRYKKWEATQSL